MKTLNIEDLASHGGPEPWVGRPRGRRPSVGRGTRRRSDRAAKSSEIGVPTASPCAEGNIVVSVSGELTADPALSENPCTHRISMCETRESPRSPVVVMAGRAARGRPRP